MANWQIREAKNRFAERPVVETLRAATAIRHKLTLVTCGTLELDGVEVSLLDLWG